MLNRVLQVRLVKNPLKETPKVNVTEDEYEGAVAIAAHTAELVVRKVAMAALGYVVLDTVRQVLVAKAIQN